MGDDVTKQIAKKITSIVAHMVSQMPPDDMDEIELLAACIYGIEKEVGRRMEMEELYVVLRLSTKAINACIASGSPTAWAIAAMENFDED